MERRNTYLATIWGLVQGVGFRPFIYRLAHDFQLKGWVNNTNENVQISINADREILEQFITQIREQAPPASEIESIDIKELEGEDYSDFRIIESENLSDRVTEVSPDIAVCKDCMQDMKQQPNRIDYPLLNCTNCGPRFTIVRDLPYDRTLTTMQEFNMCPSCRKEYENVLDRRFHAQPTACSDCGPVYSLTEVQGGQLAAGIAGHNAMAGKTAGLIDNGKIVTIKGLGGFFMACDAMNQEAVDRLRKSKLREGKPFAVMFRDLGAIAEHCEITPAEKAELVSWRRPIVILRNKPDPNLRQDDKGWLAPSVSNGFPTTGVMLPYMPFHYLLFEKLNTPAIVLTSGNLSEEPIMISNDEAETILSSVSDAILSYNREIHNRCDDSVTLVINEKPRLLRRSRGYVPNPIRLHLETEGIFAAGAELVNCFAMGKGKHAIMSQHIGDLKNFETFEFYRETCERFKRLFRMEPALVAHDLHPDYLSTSFARELGLPAIPIQHHHAHIASVLAEYKLDEKVIGVSFDGTGLGDDNKIWGSEFLVCDLEGYERITHLEYMPVPGGDMATYEPWRMAVAMLYSLYGMQLLEFDLPFLKEIDPALLEMVIQSIEKSVNCPLSSGAGRLFDAVSALLNICTVSQFHAEAPMRLEMAVSPGENSIYPYTFGEVVGMGPTIESILEDLGKAVDPGLISARFHNTISMIILETISRISKEHGITKVALSGGAFQNKYLSARTENQLRDKGFEVLVPQQLPANDGGIALGQLAIAAKHRSLGLG